MSTSLTLSNIDPTRNRKRFYRVSECRDLFGEICLFLEWGRLGSRPRWRLVAFQSANERARQRAAILNQRKRHGYVEAA